jgi:hypothetical protein
LIVILSEHDGREQILILRISFKKEVFQVCGTNENIFVRYNLVFSVIVGGV